MAILGIKGKAMQGQGVKGNVSERDQPLVTCAAPVPKAFLTQHRNGIQVVAWDGLAQTLSHPFAKADEQKFLIRIGEEIVI